jgi:hypothetical protein
VNDVFELREILCLINATIPQLPDVIKIIIMKKYNRHYFKFSDFSDEQAIKTNYFIRIFPNKQCEYDLGLYSIYLILESD